MSLGWDVKRAQDLIQQMVLQLFQNVEDRGQDLRNAEWV
jgi:hypothetical protein